MNIIFLGPPGAGKGTQAQIVCQRLGIPQVSTGDMLRAAIAAGTEMGRKAKEYMDQGQLVPDEVVIGIVKDRLADPDCQKGYILDGFPRTVEQAKALSTFAKIDVAINLDVPDDVLVKRLSGRRVCPLCGAPYHVDRLNGETVCRADGTPLIQRDDDKAETVLNRLAVYHQKTAPLIDHYREAGLLKNIGGGLSLEEISEEIFRTLEAIQ
ncbi:MAG: adenylate kinase [Christensenellales bacterium]|jgi:adenylate kinase|nr:adenylate kinase [Clostridiales bacterium]MEE1440669.1 adenylate kinase [Christensenellales bacterium]HIR80395.1 adenylate kinase [Candidatus Limiplasma merdipullorum]